MKTPPLPGSLRMKDSTPTSPILRRPFRSTLVSKSQNSTTWKSSTRTIWRKTNWTIAARLSMRSRRIWVSLPTRRRCIFAMSSENMRMVSLLMKWWPDKAQKRKNKHHLSSSLRTSLQMKFITFGRRQIGTYKLSKKIIIEKNGTSSSIFHRQH